MNGVLRFLNLLAIFTLITLGFCLAVKANYHCKMEAGDVGKLHYRAATQKEAALKVAEACLDKRIELHLINRGQLPDNDRWTTYMLSCVNAMKCWEKQ